MAKKTQEKNAKAGLMVCFHLRFIFRITYFRVLSFLFHGNTPARTGGPGQAHVLKELVAG
ncbi:hypothetical protein [Janthinobacterium lividum]|uniref:hypothetical protein n=1 Tax=Janthinobacterium lividum TaxID=29581 RepID=UPI0011138D74|nr:hypothetical protein [Janthinobacterium lividum]